MMGAGCVCLFQAVLVRAVSSWGILRLAGPDRAHHTYQSAPTRDPLPTGVRHPSSCLLCPWDFLMFPGSSALVTVPGLTGAAPPGMVYLMSCSILFWSQGEPVGLKHMAFESVEVGAPAAGWSVVSVREGLPDWTSFSPQALI